MNLSLSSASINGYINAPASKSEFQRVVAASVLCCGESTIYNPSFCDDGKIAISIAQDLGAEIRIQSDFISITGGLNPKQSIFNFGESALALRLFAPIIGLKGIDSVLNASKTLLLRPTSLIIETLSSFGLKFEKNNENFPIIMNGKLVGGKKTVDGSISSQLISGLLMALPCLENDSEIEIINVKSKPYIELTLSILKDFGINIKYNSDFNHFYVKGNQKYLSKSHVIEGDWSSMSFMIVAGLIAGKIKIGGLNKYSKQADRKIMEVLDSLKATYIWENEDLLVTKSHLYPFEFDAIDSPDLFPPLVVLASYCRGISKIRGLHRLSHKESNRAEVLKQEFNNIGIKIEIIGDDMLIYGNEVNGGIFNSHGDHRMAMAAAIVSVGAKNPILIKHIEVVSKSYPDFFYDLKTISQQTV